MAFIPKGIIPAMVTPLTRDGKVNEKALRQFIDYLIKGASHGLFVVGTTGEFYGLSPEEKKELFEITVDQTRGRVPVYAGTGAITTREVIQLTRYANKRFVRVEACRHCHFSALIYTVFKNWVVNRERQQKFSMEPPFIPPT